MEQAMAGLLHDIATPVFAHVVDFLHGDHMSQESTEAGTGQWIRGSGELRRVLEKFEIPVEAVEDYHRYPIADNDSPRLSADRLEYTLGNLWNYGFSNLNEIRSSYEDLIVGCNEAGEKELLFRTPETASWFARSALKTSRVYIADEDRFAMQALADLLRRAMERNVIRYKDLWTAENEVLARLSLDPLCREEWETFCGYNRIERYEEKPEEGYAVRIGAKKRWIDPIAAGKGRVSSWESSVAEEMAELRAIRFDQWLVGKAK
jgi:HD superfamily phosphohydrolase